MEPGHRLPGQCRALAAAAAGTGGCCSRGRRYALASDALRKRIQVAGGWDGDQIATEWDAWQQSAEALITTARTHLDHL